jgi:hypothetical protein
VVLGFLGFLWHFAAVLKRGAPSAAARLDYWQAGVRITRAYPLFGSGPGTFGLSYGAIRRPESEPAKLTHNDYLEQACDSGLPGFVLYAAFILGALWWSAPYYGPSPSGRQAPADADGLAALWRRLASAGGETAAAGSAATVSARNCFGFAVWLGVLGWSLQGFVEFGLYVPALAWPAFAFLGWLLQKP